MEKGLFPQHLHLGNVFGGEEGQKYPAPSDSEVAQPTSSSFTDLRNAAPKMSCFASISMQTAGPPFPEVKITASVCTKSHLEPRQTPLIWRLLAPTSYFRGTEGGGKNSERK